MSTGSTIRRAMPVLGTAAILSTTAPAPGLAPGLAPEMAPGVGPAAAPAPAASQPAATFTNPVCGSGADPWVINWQGGYLYCFSKGGALWVSRAPRLQDIGSVEPKRVWTPPRGTAHSHNLWAPELHRLDGKWYIYYAADDGDNYQHRMYVLEAAGDDPQGSYTFKGKISAPGDHWAIDGTLFTTGDGKHYLIWSGWEGRINLQQNLYIARLKNPWTIDGERVCIAVPQHPWEKIGRPLVAEGPVILRNPAGKVFIIYSASGSWTDDYCLGQLAFTGGDPLKPSSWVKHPEPVFSKTGTVFGPGHASFVKSPDGKEDWIVYHAAKYAGAGWKRDVRIQRFTWNPDGSPHFSKPVPTGMALVEPSGAPALVEAKTQPATMPR